MKIRKKLTLAFISVALFVTIAGYFSISMSKNTLLEKIEEDSAILVSEIIDDVDRRIYMRIETFQEYCKSLLIKQTITESNKEFDKLDDVQAYIDKQDKLWISVPKQDETVFMRELMNNELSEELREKLNFYGKRYEYKVFNEVLVTNKYGACVAITQKTTDYYQADEEWWQEAKANGLYIDDVKYDVSADVYSTDICIRIDDEVGNFLGVIKVVLNIEDSINLLKQIEITEDCPIGFKLLTKSGKIIYATDDYEFFDDLFEQPIFRFFRESHRNNLCLVAGSVKTDKDDELLAHAHSRGYKGYKGLGWILLIEYEKAKIFAPITRLRNWILIFSITITAFSIVLGFLISRSISVPIEKLTSATAKIGQGNMNIRVEINSNDETGILAKAFNDMADKRKKAEIALENSRKEAEAANEAKGLFLANMSHEIRTPMNAIIGFSDILMEEDLAEQQMEYIHTIHRSGKHLLQLINDILDLSKIEAGKLDVEKDECSLGCILAAVESMMNVIAEDKGLEFKILEDKGLPANIYTDSSRLQQCLINLLNNAIKFTKEGYVYLKVSLESRGEKPYIRFDVEDTGIGISPDKHKLIFDSFVQGDNHTAHKYGGTGLGLTITKQLVELLGGEIKLTSEQGKGSVFTIVIPVGLDIKKQPFLDRHDISSHTLTDSEKTEHAKFSGHVLVAEDVETNQMFVKLLLKRLGFDVTIVEDGEQAIKEALGREFDLIFMDIQMPNMNGYEATELIRKEGITTPIIALTANAMKGDAQKCIDAGCSDYLAKPLGRHRLLEKVRKYIPFREYDPAETVDSVNSQNDKTEICRDTNSSETKSDIVFDVSEEIISWERLIERLGDEELVKEVVPIFLKDNTNRFEMLAKAIEESDTKQIKFYAHALKGAGGNIGSRQLWDTAYNLECAGKDNDIEAAISYFKDLKSVFEKVVAFLSLPDWIEIAKHEKVFTDRG